MKIVTIVGARPHFIKAAPVSRAIAEHNRHVTDSSAHITELIVHTGQHYDDNMSAVFFRDLNIPEPEVNLGVGSGPHGWQTGQMLMRIEEVLVAEKPNWVLVYGDTNSTLAGALAAAKLHIPVAHVEAGLRSFNRKMPEEHNRVLTDHCSTLLFCPTKHAMENLRKEGRMVDDSHAGQSLYTSHLSPKACLVGDVMYDSVIYYIKVAEKRPHVLERLKLQPKNYVLATVHRAENTNEPKRLKSIFDALYEISQDGLPVVVPLHPRTKKLLISNDASALTPHTSLKIIDSVSYLDILLLEKQACVVLTDSGGMQKEAYWFGVPCVTLRNETEWVELVDHGCNILAGSNKKEIYQSYCTMINKEIDSHVDLFGNGHASQKIVEILATLQSKT